MGARSRSGRPVSEDEARLWQAVTREITPLEGRTSAAESTLDASERAASSAPAGPQRQQPPARSTVQPPTPAHKKLNGKHPPLADFDPRRARKLAGGKLRIEARLDLHGLRQDEARTALWRFLHRTQASGLRHVKVITGKGGIADDRHLRPFDLFGDHRRGVLRELVPRWLSEPDLRPVVVSFTWAAQGHGGTGALYVQLRGRKVVTPA